MSEVISWLGFGAVTILVLALFAYAFVRHLPYSRSLRGILLDDATSREAGYLSAPDRDDLVGAEGIAVTSLRPSGTAEFGDERIDVVTEGPYLDAGARVKILRADGYRHVVRALGAETQPSDGSDAS